jgi:6-phosphogluconolactonase
MLPSKTIRITLGMLLVSSLSSAPAGGLTSPKHASDNAAASRETILVYIGTFTGAESKGIYLSRLDPATGALTPPVLAVETANPGFLEVDGSNRRLFAVNQIDDYAGQSAGAVSAYSIDPATGRLTSLNQQSSLGKGPCHLLLDREGRNVLVANYRSGSVAVLPVERDGRLGPASTVVQHNGKSVNPERQQGPHAHCVTLDPANRFAFVCDLGLDKVMVYKFDAREGSLSPAEPPFVATRAGAGPRHMTFHPDGRHAYVIHELDSPITAYACDAADGSLRELQTLSTLPEGFIGNNTTAEIQAHPSGKFLFGSNRGHDSIAVFAVHPANGTLTRVQIQSTLGKKPRHFGIDPAGKYLLAANQDSNTIAVFTIDPRTGHLKPTGQTVTAPSPVCVKFLPARPAVAAKPY